MARQARAGVTRGRIIDAAVDLFSEVGYGDTDLAAIVKRAGITKGAFHYHFESKERIAGTIIDEGNLRLRKVFADADQTSSSALQNLIVATFGVARLRTDRLVGTGNLLVQSLRQIGDTGLSLYPNWLEVFIEHLRTVAAQGDMRSDVDPLEAGETICASVLGSQLLSDALGEDVCYRLARTWQVLISAIVPEESVPYFQEFLARVAAQYPANPVVVEDTGP